MYKIIMRLIVLFSSLSSVAAFAAEPVDLSKQKIQILHSFLSTTRPKAKGPTGYDLKETRRSIDFNQTEHIRFNQTYDGYLVWGAEAIVHIPHTSKADKALANPDHFKAKMNGVLYQELQKDLQNPPTYIFTPEQAEKALHQAVTDYTAQSKLKGEIQNKESKIIVYMDDQNKAHWAFYLSFYVKANRPAKPVYLMDAIHLTVYETWNEVKRLSNDDVLENVKGGGFGGNPNLGKLIYDGLQGHLPKLDIKRDPVKKMCYLANDSVRVTDYQHQSFVEFPCEKKEASHDDVYWNGALHAVNGGYSPDNDALYAGKVVIDLYQAWFSIPVLTRNNKPMLLEMVTHSPNYEDNGESDPDNALWNPVEEKMYFGDGEIVFYPLTSIGVTAHEVSHGFTEQHSNLIYTKQSGGMDEAFSDIAAQAAEFFVSDGNNSWQMCSEISKVNGKALRYLDQPSKDCNDRRIPGERCSISHIKEYDRYVRDHRYDRAPITRYPDVHYSSGIFNRVFYLMATANEWGSYKQSFRKAFNVMVKAQDHWRANSTFLEGACGVLAAAADYQYDTTPIKRAFLDVGIDTSSCQSA